CSLLTPCLQSFPTRRSSDLVEAVSEVITDDDDTRLRISRGGDGFSCREYAFERRALGTDWKSPGCPDRYRWLKRSEEGRHGTVIGQEAYVGGVLDTEESLRTRIDDLIECVGDHVRLGERPG